MRPDASYVAPVSCARLANRLVEVFPGDVEHREPSPSADARPRAASVRCSWRSLQPRPFSCVAHYDSVVEPKHADAFATTHTGTLLDVSANVLLLVAGVVVGVLGYVIARLRRA